MAILHEYHCPTSLAEALRLVDAPDRRRHLLAGGTTLVGALRRGHGATSTAWSTCASSASTRSAPKTGRSASAP
ncbi:MAG: hypothetical protein R2851_25860 [Caldilineaceae bacterium]